MKKTKHSNISQLTLSSTTRIGIRSTLKTIIVKKGFGLDPDQSFIAVFCYSIFMIVRGGTGQSAQ
jgi:hypothetical protein